jgi:pyridoxal phosphate enzyme (YggS family)
MELSIINNFKYLNLNILNICKKINRNPSEINLVAVSKGQDKKKVKELLTIGHKSFGENRMQEAVLKWENIISNGLNLHYIGALQSKKVKEIYNNFDVIETLDTESSIKKIAECNEKKIKKNNPKIYIQINIGNESQKRGLLPSEVEGFLNMCREKYKLNISGAMCLPPKTNKPSKYFKLMKEICLKYKLHDISMGMSNDYLSAIEHGSTNIRIGSLIFGKRKN